MDRSLIKSYSFGRIEINGKGYTNDVIVFRDRVESNWWREKGHSLCPSDLKLIIEESPEILIIGTGAYGRMDVPERTKNFLDDRGVEFFVHKTGPAVNRFNKITTKNKAAALHLTC
ncbi:MAG: Mth938-like domain-containing protein [Candidatus Hadarchaeia archaeon]